MKDDSEIKELSVPNKDLRNAFMSHDDENVHKIQKFFGVN